MKSLFHLNYFYLIPIIVLSFSINIQAQDISVGIVEFEEKNSIGVENAGRIIAEWIVTEMKRIGKFQIQERLLLNKVLEEQNLMLSGVIDEGQVSEIGKLYGVNALVTGSVMKVGDIISVTGRIINIENGEVLKTASINTISLTELETEIIVLSNALCDISRTQWEVKTDIKRKSIALLQAGGGLAYTWDNVDYSSLGIQVMIRYRDKWGSVWIDGVPLGGMPGIEAGVSVNITPFLGIAANGGIVFDNEVDSANSTYINAGIVVSPRANIEAGILLGIAPSGSLWTDDPEITDFPAYFRIPANYSVWFEYQLEDNLVFIAKYTGTEFEFPEADVPPAPYWNPFNADTGRLFQTDKLTLGVLYSFAIE